MKVSILSQIRNLIKIFRVLDIDENSTKTNNQSPNTSHTDLKTEPPTSPRPSLESTARPTFKERETPPPDDEYLMLAIFEIIDIWDSNQNIIDPAKRPRNWKDRVREKAVRVVGGLEQGIQAAEIVFYLADLLERRDRKGLVVLGAAGLRMRVWRRLLDPVWLPLEDDIEGVEAEGSSHGSGSGSG